MHPRHVLALVALAATLVAGCAPAAGASRTPPAAISVTGTGRVSVKPDVALVRVGAEARSVRLADATADVARRMTAALAAVKALGLADRDVTTVAYSVDPLAPPRRSGEEPAAIVGYRVVNVVELRVRDLGAVGRVLDAAVGAGANVMRGLRLTLDDPSKAQAEARARAVAEAATRAGQLAAAAGVRLGELISLSEGGARPVIERYAPLRAGLAASAPGPIEAGELEVVVTVEAQYLIAR